MIELYGGYIRYVRQWIVFVSQISLLLVSLFHLLKKKKYKDYQQAWKPFLPTTL